MGYDAKSVAKYVIKEFEIVLGKGLIKRTTKQEAFSSSEFELLVLESQKNCSAEGRERNMRKQNNERASKM